MRNKSIAFDLDHTIGYFKQFIHILNQISIDKTNDSYHDLFDLFPEYFRPNIFSLFEYLLLKRNEKKIKYIILYTNNNNDIFVNKVIEYINYKLSAIFFDIVITTTHPKRKNKDKNYNDLIECTNLNQDATICFIDDKKHANMICKSVFYIRCEPYIYSIYPNEIYNRIKVTIPVFEKKGYTLNMNNQKRVTEQLLNRIKWFIQS
jgi:hypothetical protein